MSVVNEHKYPRSNNQRSNFMKIKLKVAIIFILLLLISLSGFRSAGGSFSNPAEAAGFFLFPLIVALALWYYWKKKAH